MEKRFTDGGSGMQTVGTAQMKAIDERAIREYGIPSLTLMERAAAHVADAVMRRKAASAVAVCGTGNNGGDGLACARLLHGRGVAVTVFLVGAPEKMTPDAKENARRLEEAGIALLPYTGQELPDCGCIVDALFGFGLSREVTGLYRRAVEAMNASSAPVIACDLPSGLCGDTGEVMGVCIRAAETVTFTCAKRGLLAPGAEAYTGALTVADIGIPGELLP